MGSFFDINFKWVFFLILLVLAFLLFGVTNIKWILIIAAIVYLIKMLKG